MRGSPKKPSRVKPATTKSDADELLPIRLAALTERLAREIENPLRLRYELPVKDWKVMQALAAHGPLPPNEIHRIGGQNKSQISRALTCLLDRELVAKKPHPDDSRTFLVSLTPAGKRMFSTIVRQMLERQSELLERLTPNDVALLNDLVHLEAALSSVSRESDR